MGVVALSLVSFDRAEEGQSGVSDGQEGLRSVKHRGFGGPADGSGCLATEEERMTRLWEHGQHPLARSRTSS